MFTIKRNRQPGHWVFHCLLHTAWFKSPQLTPLNNRDLTLVPTQSIFFNGHEEVKYGPVMGWVKMNYKFRLPNKVNCWFWNRMIDDVNNKNLVDQVVHNQFTVNMQLYISNDFCMMVGHRWGRKQNNFFFKWNTGVKYRNSNPELKK